MDPTLAIALLWLAFTATHVGLSSLSLRPRLVAALGQVGFLGLYSVVALAIFVPLIRLYFQNVHAGAQLWTLPRGPLLSWTVYLGMGLAFVLLVSSLMRPSPGGVVPGETTPHGVYRITRHPMVMAFVVYALFHLLPNGSSADLAFFGGFAVFALIGAAHQDQRKLVVGPPGYRDFYERTPFLPFTGRETLAGLRELSPIAVAVGIALTVTIRWFHAGWFGGNP
ncbi:MAG: hypothetical protein FJ108_00395 [Deltaproteobacteria bacterium]|nr:hypothetical protein [Deltaproteobacteria bacterium]